MARQYAMISADSHLEIAPERWTGRVPEKWRDRAPRLVKLPSGGDGVVVENRPLYVLGLAITGRPYQEHQLYGLQYEGNFGAGSPEHRLEEQDRDGVDAEVLFTSAGNGGFWRGIKNDEAYAAVVHAYNEFLADEYCAPDRERLLAMGIIPNTSIDVSVAELGYCARAGLKGVALNGFPSGKSFPTPEDDRFWAASLELNMPLTVHVSFVQQDGPVFRYVRVPTEEVAFGADPVANLTRFGGGIARNAIQLVMAGVFDRFPTLRVYWAETQIGWLPHFLPQTDDNYERMRYWAEREFDLKYLPRQVSSYLRDNCVWGFLKDSFGVRARYEIGVGSVMWGSDFPHSAGDWPHSRELISEMFAGVPDGERSQMIAGNAVEFFHLDQAAPAGNGAAAGRAASQVS